MSPEAATWWPYVVILVGGWLATDVWRYLGVAAAARVDENGPVFLWVKAVATGLVAGVIAQLVLSPAGALAEMPLVLRLVAVAAGFATFLVSGRRVFAGLLVAELVLILGGLFTRP